MVWGTLNPFQRNWPLQDGNGLKVIERRCKTVSKGETNGESKIQK